MVSDCKFSRNFDFMNINWKNILTQSIIVIIIAIGIVTMYSPQALAAPADAAYAALKAGDNNKAIALFEQALKTDPNNVILRTNLAYTFLKMGENQSGLSQLLTIVTQNPRKTELWSQIGYLQLKLNQTDDANRSFQNAVDAYPNDDGARMQLAYLLLGKGEKQKAIEQFSKAAQSSNKAVAEKARKEITYLAAVSPNSTPSNDPPSSSLAEQAYAAQKAGKDKQAIELFEEALKTDPHNAVLRQNLAYALLRIGLKQQALSQFIIVATQNPTDTNLWQQIGYLQLEEGQTDDAIKSFRKAVTADPHNDTASLQLGYLLDNEGQDKEAIELFSRVAKSPNKAAAAKAKLALAGDTATSDSAADKAYAALQAGNDAEAIKFFQQAVENEPENLGLGKDYAYALVADGQNKEALSQYLKLTEQHPKDADLWRSVAIVQLNLEQVDGAISSYRKILVFDPTSNKVRIRLAYLLADNGKIEEAFHLFAIASNDKNSGTSDEASSALYDLVVAHPELSKLNDEVDLGPLALKDPKAAAYAAQKLGKNKQAIEFFQKALLIDPQDEGLRSDYAQTLLKSGDKKQALSQLLIVATQNPQDSAIWSEIGNIQLNLHQKDDAIKSFQKAVETNPTANQEQLQLGYMYAARKEKKDALGHFTTATTSFDPLLTRQAHQAISGVTGIYPKGTRWSDIYGSLSGESRFRDLTGQLILRYGVVLHSKPRTDAYIITRVDYDSRSRGGTSPEIFNDNYISLGVGVRRQIHRNIFAYAEGDYAFPLLNRPVTNKGAEARIGVNGYADHFINRKNFTSRDFDISYYSRYANIIGYADLKRGYYLLGDNYSEGDESTLAAYVGLDLTGDAQGQYYNNLAEGVLGLRYSPRQLPGISLSLEAAVGHYLGRETSDSPNPYKGTYSNFRILLTYSFSHQD